MATRLLKHMYGSQILCIYVNNLVHLLVDIRLIKIASWCTTLHPAAAPLITSHEAPHCPFFAIHYDVDYVSTYQHVLNFAPQIISTLCRKGSLLSFSAICWANVQSHAHLSFQPVSAEISAFSFVH